MNDTVQALMRAATRLTQAGRLTEATAAIQRALGRGGAVAEASVIEPDANVLDGCVFERDPRPSPRPAAPWVPPAPQAGGDFIEGRHRQAGQTHRYKLYVPPGPATAPRPLLVMLHGCTQNPDDFATGTAMNARALEQGLLVLYPAQSDAANPQRCWNWFQPEHQRRGAGEPDWLAGLTQAVIDAHGVDAQRVYIAGLSAGGAMAAIVAEAYPELFVAVGVHSGLPCGAAAGLPEALAAMKRGAKAPRQAAVARPTIVFHGDQDRTVHPRNGEQVAAAARGAAPAGAAQVEQRGGPGRRCTRTRHDGGAGGVAVEHWLVHGAGHAWAGGDARGSYTDARGPDASREMLRFFAEQAERGRG